MAFGKCPDVDNVTNLDKAAYAGLWYETERDQFFPFTMGSSCTFKDLTLDSNGDLDLWFGSYSMFSYGGAPGKLYCEDGMAETCDATMSGDVRFPFPVVATDYTTYDIGYYCMDMIENFMKLDYIMVYSRTPEMSEETKATVKAIILEKVPSYNYNWQILHSTSHNDCTYDHVQKEE